MSAAPSPPGAADTGPSRGPPGCAPGSSDPTDTQRERRLVFGERLNHRADAEEMRRIVDTDTSSRVATRTGAN